MATASVNLDTTQYVRVNVSHNTMILQVHNDAVRIVLSDNKPALNNLYFHLLTPAAAPLHFASIDTNVWALATSAESNLIVSETSDLISDSFKLAVSKGNVPGYSTVHKFGHAPLTTAIVPVATSGVYQTPTSAQSLEIVSSDAGDAVAGVGAVAVTVEGLDSNFELQTEEVLMNGATPVPLANQYTRLFRMYVSQSGSYATQTVPSHLGAITVRGAGAGAVWGLIDNTPMPLGQSEIGVYTVPRGYAAYLLDKHSFVDTNQAAEVYFFQRTNADDVTPPYTGAMRLIQREIGLTGAATTTHDAPKGPFVGPCDLGFLGKTTASTSNVSVEFELILIKDGF